MFITENNVRFDYIDLGLLLGFNEYNGWLFVWSWNGTELDRVKRPHSVGFADQCKAYVLSWRRLMREIEEM